MGSSLGGVEQLRAHADPSEERCPSCGATKRPLFTEVVGIEELLQLLRPADRDEEWTSHTRLAQTRRLALPVECVVPAQGSAEVAKEDYHSLALIADNLTNA